MSGASETAAETVETVVENVEANAAAAVAIAEARAERAEETAEALADAALRDALSDRITDTEEDIEECHARLENLEFDLASQLRTLTETSAKMEAALLVLATLATPPPSSSPTLKTPPAEVTEKSETTITPIPENKSPGADGLPVPDKKRESRFRLT